MFPYSQLKPLLATIEKGLVLRRLGRLEEEDRTALRSVLDDILGDDRSAARSQESS